MSGETPHKLCGAKAKSTGHPCKLPAMANGRCRYHGGLSLGGVASPTFKHGRYSKYAPKRILERYESSLVDPELISVRDEIALLDARLSVVVEQVLDAGESRAWLNEVRATYAAMLSALKAHDNETANSLTFLLGELIDAGATQTQSWDDILRLIDARRKLVDTEQKRLVAMQQMITTDQALVLVARIQEIIMASVVDSSTRVRIASKLKELVGAI